MNFLVNRSITTIKLTEIIQKSVNVRMSYWGATKSEIQLRTSVDGLHEACGAGLLETHRGI